MNAVRQPWWIGVAATLGAAALWLLARTWRIEERNAPEFEEAKRSHEPVIYALWHARQLPLVYVHRGRGTVVLVSQSRDGELISRILAAFGSQTARGSSTRGGDTAVRELLAAAAAGHCLAITPDGPRGPAGRAKPGLLQVAARSGLRVVPLASAARRSWVLRSWDRFRIPQPFARVCVAHAAPMAITAADDAGTLERERARVERAMDELTAEVMRRAGESG
ncbi:MAG: lysophospholipid acyltransferase family protein [Candidatus Eisenbacteria bacterium]|nr:lysophospholipid acyltransferase family protein [Candidatus Eisenbacteria bacterium]